MIRPALDVKAYSFATVPTGCVEETFFIVPPKSATSPYFTPETLELLFDITVADRYARIAVKLALKEQLVTSRTVP